MRHWTFALWVVLVVLLCETSDGAKRSRSRKFKRNRHRLRSSNLKAPYSGQSIRLGYDNNSGNLTSGRVEVYIHGRFGTVCDDKWDKRGADIACRQMGYLRGAIATTKGSSFGTGSWRDEDILMDDVNCDGNPSTIQDCDWSYPSDCSKRDGAGVICKENTGCPDDWIAGPTGCYQLPRNTVTKQEYAVNKCLARGGHLVNIETEAEHNFLAHVFKNETDPLLTGAVKLSGSWLWESVTSEDMSGEKVRSKVQTPIEIFKWFPGWQPGDVYPEPSNLKKERCIFLSSSYEHPNGSDVNLDYHFWKDDQCRSTRKRFASGMRYICERPREQKNDEFGCYVGLGAMYRGEASHTDKGTPCMKWTSAIDINQETYPHSGLGDHNYCRNPDNDDRPWCWISHGYFEFCDIPQCIISTTETSGSETGIDEEEGCRQDAFTCRDGSCVPLKWRCDMELDCPDREDEPETCDYKLEQFKKTRGYSVRNHLVETYVGTTNETCARYCMESKTFVCRSFSFSARTRDCLLSDQNTDTVEMKLSRREDIYELIPQLDDCDGLFKCKNGRCIDNDLVCDGTDQCQDITDESDCGRTDVVEVRLADGDEMSGRVEVKYHGEWGMVCDDSWDKKDAKVVCNMLGFSGDSVKAISGSYYGNGNGQFFLDEVECDGTETNIDQCGHNDWKKSDCYKWETASVRCSRDEECLTDTEFRCSNDNSCVSVYSVCDKECDCPGCTDEHSCDGAIELQAGRTPAEGRVQITFAGVVGTICDDDFDDVEASVVCRSLGYSSGTAAKNTLFGPGTGVIWIDDIKCEGHETNITQCQYIGPGEQNCGHDEDVGVICQTEEEEMKIELVEGPDKYSGRVELSRDGDRGTICDDEWDDNDARVVCRMLGFRGGKARDGAWFGAGSYTTRIFLDDVKCSGDEISIDNCRHSDWLVNNCEHSEDAGVECEPEAGVPTTTEETSTPETTTERATTVLAPVSTAEDCYDGSTPYMGTIAVTENDLECQAWASIVPHNHTHMEDSKYPDGSVSEASNYCRNPDGDAQHWCYTTNPDERWGYCSIPKCEPKDTCYTIAETYSGTMSQTTYGHTCQSWSLNTPQNHKFHDGDMFPEGSVSKARNYCRAPEGDVTPWCYTTDPNIRWEYCNVPKCAGQFNYNATCGIRPLEATRSRRGAGPFSDLDVDLNDFPDLDLSLYRKMGRIFGGTEASYGMYPWQAGIRKRSSGFLSYHHHACGGTIIGEYWILSAAHCYKDVSKGQIIVRTGDQNSNRKEKYEQEFDVEAIFGHRLYNSDDFDNDIALLKLKPVHGRGIVFNDYVQPACLPEESTEYVKGQRCLISGWGASEDDTVNLNLRAARVPLVDDATCSKLYKNGITSNMACAGYVTGGTDSCAGDSGGPLVCEIDGKYTVMGATSFGEDCAVANAPGVYARVTAFITWIKRHLNDYS